MKRERYNSLESFLRKMSLMIERRASLHMYFFSAKLFSVHPPVSNKSFKVYLDITSLFSLSTTLSQRQGRQARPPATPGHWPRCHRPPMLGHCLRCQAAPGGPGPASAMSVVTRGWWSSITSCPPSLCPCSPARGLDMATTPSSVRVLMSVQVY